MPNMSDLYKTTENTGPSRMHLILINVWSYSGMLLWTLFGIVFFPFAFAFCRLVLLWSTAKVMRLFIWLYGRGWLILMSPFVQFHPEHMDKIQRDKPYLFVVNHLSFFDTYCMAMLPVFDISFAVRSWPFKMPWYSVFMRMARYLDVEGNRWEETLDDCKGVFADQGAVLFFPEGHRSRDGQLQRFYSGGFKVASSAGIPLVPLCIDGTDRLLPPGRWLLSPCQVRLRVLEPIDTSSFSGEGGHLRLRKKVKGQMALALAEMRGEKITSDGETYEPNSAH